MLIVLVFGILLSVLMNHESFSKTTLSYFMEETDHCVTAEVLNGECMSQSLVG
jgi:hypothetical protein